MLSQKCGYVVVRHTRRNGVWGAEASCFLTREEAAAHGEEWFRERVLLIHPASVFKTHARLTLIMDVGARYDIHEVLLPAFP